MLWRSNSICFSYKRFSVAFLFIKMRLFFIRHGEFFCNDLKQLANSLSLLTASYMIIRTVDFPNERPLNFAIKTALLLRLSQLPHKCP